MAVQKYRSETITVKVRAYNTGDTDTATYYGENLKVKVTLTNAADNTIVPINAILSDAINIPANTPQNNPIVVNFGGVDGTSWNIPVDPTNVGGVDQRGDYDLKVELVRVSNGAGIINPVISLAAYNIKYGFETDTTITVT